MVERRYHSSYLNMLSFKLGQRAGRQHPSALQHFNSCHNKDRDLCIDAALVMIGEGDEGATVRRL